MKNILRKIYDFIVFIFTTTYITILALVEDPFPYDEACEDADVEVKE
jgi:hypothetical protein